MVLLAHRLLAAFAALHQRIGDVMGTDMTDKKRTRNELEAAISHGLRHSQSAEETWPKEDFDITLARANSLPMFSPATQQAEPVAIYDGIGFITPHGDPVPIGPLYAAPPADPCPQCERGGVCNTIECGRKRSSELMRLYGTAAPVDDEAVRLLHHVRMVLPNDRWADDTKRAIDAYLAKVNK